MTESLLRRGILSALYGTTALAVAMPLAQAQDQDDAEQLETITVVGSRIKRTDIETSQPVFVLEREDLQKTGLVSIGDILQDLTNNGSTLNTSINNGGNGETRVDLRNCGSGRTLVLVNGKRWVTSASLDNGVDLNTVPVATIERIEVLKDGAGPVYGSDAICGVVNITLRDSYDGAEASAYLGENEEGDGRTEQYDFTVGSASDRASVVMNASYAKQEPIFAGDREVSAVPLFGFPGNTAFPGRASAATPFGNYTVSGVTGTQTLIPGRAGCATPTNFAPGATNVCGTGSRADFRPFTFVTDGYNFAPDNYLQTPQERTSVFVKSRYSLTDAISFNAIALYNERRSEQRLAVNPIVIGPAGAGIARTITISPQNIYNPFGATVTGGQYRPFEPKRTFTQDVDSFYFSGGFDGVFDLFDRSFSWDVNYIYSDTERRDTTIGLQNLERIRLGLGPSFVNAQGVPTCGTAAAPIAGCVPLNWFGGPDGFNRAMQDYINFTATDQRYVELTNYSANLTGDLFELPAGPLSFASGYEYRRTSGFDQPDALIASGASTGNIRQRTSGGFSLDEFYAEFNLPLLKDLTFAEIFEVSIAARYSDYSNFGDTTNPKIGFRWKPIADLLVRGNYSKGFRAPSVAELFLGRSDAFPPLNDPCSTSSNPTGETLARCRNGIGGVAPVPVGYQQLNQQIRITVGGNPDLQPELARTKTLGLVYSPSYVEGLDLYLDWYNIEITSSIAVPTGQAVMDNCYRLGDETFCALITRAPSGIVNDLFAGTRNFQGGLEIEGYDFTVDYRFDTEFGRFRINWDSAYTAYIGDVGQPEFGDINSDGAVSRGNIAGLYFDRNQSWRFRSNISTNWQRGDWGATATVRYLGSLTDNCQLGDSTANALNAAGISIRNPCDQPNGIPQFPAAANQIDATWYLDLQGTYDTPWNSRVTAGVRNVLDEDPPLVYSVNANTVDPQYDIPGRFWYVQFTQKF